MLLRLLYLTLTNVFTLTRLLPRNEHDKDAEILALRHQLTVLRWHRDLLRRRHAKASRPKRPGRPPFVQPQGVRRGPATTRPRKAVDRRRSCSSP
ncbi:hypothetical protein [Streptomyces sp. NEAU-174]|uniref:hypothetical protein n=1 Tax=Streptomyces sp. NEAU-174 TaxID=3458254 RepID=UPI004044EA12